MMKRAIIIKAIIIGVILMLLTGATAGCHRAESDVSRQLHTADSIMDIRPDSALAILSHINSDSLRGELRPWHALLLTKAIDKNYIKHQSDGDIISALHYYTSYPGSMLYLEALYYAGRVASDLGDGPAAIRFYGEAEEEAVKVDPQSELYLNILSQKGRKLADLRLYDEAELYLRKTIAVCEEINDTSNLHYDYQALGELYLSMRRLLDAEKMIDKALELKPDDRLLQCYMAGIKYEQHDNQTALPLIRGLPETIDSVSRHFALAYAADIYREAGIMDTAYIYARTLSHLPGNQNKTTAYHILLGKNMTEWLGTDSVAYYAEDFLKAVEEKYDDNEASATIMQNNLYNYTQHETKRAQAEERSMKLMMLCALLALIVMGGIIGWLVKLFQNSKRIIRMQHKVLSLEEDLILPSYESEITEKSQSAESVYDSTADLRAKIIERAGELHQDRTASYVIKRTKDGGRDIIVRALKSGHPLSDDSEIWREVEDFVEANSNDFGSKLTALSGDTLTDRERRVAFLIRCGATPTDLAPLLGRSKPTISMYRKSLCQKLFDEDKNLKELDYIIRSI